MTSKHDDDDDAAGGTQDVLPQYPEQPKWKEPLARQPNILSPDLTAPANAAKACSHTAAFALVSSLLNVVFMAFSLLPSFAIVDTGIAVVCAAFLHWKQSRIAAVLLLTLFVANKVVQVADGSLRGFGLYVGIIFLIAYANGVRASFAYHRLEQAGVP